MAREKKIRTPFEERLLAAYNIKAVKHLAEKLGVPYTTFVYWGKNPNAVPLETLQRIAKETGTTIDWILTGNLPLNENSTLSLANEGDTVIAFLVKQGTSIPIPITDDSSLAAIRKAYLALHDKEMDDVST